MGTNGSRHAGRSDVWSDFNVRTIRTTDPSWVGFAGFPGTRAWPAPIASQSGGGDATLIKSANAPMDMGGPYPASESIYFGGYSSELNTDGGTLTVTDLTPLENVRTILFQIEIGEAWGYDFFNGQLPQLTVNAATPLLLDADFSAIISRVYNGTVSMPTGAEDVYINTYALQWDVSGIEDILDFSISFVGVPHAQVYSMQLDQSSELHTSAVMIPEPSTWAMMAGALVLVAAGPLRRRKAAASPSI